MILLTTNKRDLTTDFVVLELERRGVRYLRLNTEDIADFSILLRDGTDGNLLRHYDNSNWPLEEFTGGYFRRPLAPRHEPNDEKSVGEYVVGEWSAILRSIWNALEGLWLNSPFSIQRAEDKPRQISCAKRMGLRVPDTLVTNDFDAARLFVSLGPTIAKPLRHALIEPENSLGRVIFTSRIGNLVDADREAFERAPIILQREIIKDSDIRVTVVDENVYAVAIGSQHYADTAVDWRRGSRRDLPHTIIDLPDFISRGCVEVVRSLGLRFAAIDLIRDRDQDFWFLEANPNGQWAWIERRTGLPITKSIVDALCG